LDLYQRLNFSYFDEVSSKRWRRRARFVSRLGVFKRPRAEK
jgi:hypothetical protein